MKTLPFLVVFLCLTLTFGLKPKAQAQAHLRGKIGQTQAHQMRKTEEHNLKDEGNEHKQKLLKHESISYTTNDHKHMAQMSDGDTNTNDQQNHELFGHHSSSTSHHRHERNQGHKLARHDWGDSTSNHRHDWGDTSTTTYNHKMRQDEHKKRQNHEQVLASDTSSPTSSSDWAYHKKQQQGHKAWGSGDDDTDTNQQMHKKGEHKVQKHEVSATSSYTSSSDYHRMEDNTEDGHMVRTRHHQAELHDEYSHEDQVNRNGANNNDNNDDDDDMTDYGNYDDNDNNGFTQQSGHGCSQPRVSSHVHRQAHRQNDRDQPNNGDVYYYVDEDKIPQQQDTSETSSLTQANLRDYVDYNKPLDPDHPLVKEETNVVTTEVPDTVGAGKGADISPDDDTSVSSPSTVSSSVKYFYDRQTTTGQATNTGGNQQTTYTTSTTSTYPTDTTTSQYQYHKTSTTMTNGQDDDSNDDDNDDDNDEDTNYDQTTTAQTHHQQKNYKYEADANAHLSDTTNSHKQTMTQGQSTTYRSDNHDNDDNDNDDDGDDDNGDDSNGNYNNNDNYDDNDQIAHKMTSQQKNSINHQNQLNHHQTTENGKKAHQKASQQASPAHKKSSGIHHLQYGTSSTNDDDYDDMNNDDNDNNNDNNNADGMNVQNWQSHKTTTQQDDTNQDENDYEHSKGYNLNRLNKLHKYFD